MFNWTSTFGNVTNSSFDRNTYLTDYLGPKRGSVESVAILTTVYCIIFFTGVIGNVSTCIVVAKNSYMHTATNFYLFSLAISDVLILILGLPPELYSIWESYPWKLGESFCIFKSFLSEMTSYASVLTITAFTIERYVAICHPIKAQTLSSLSRAVKIIISIWILACLSALPYPAYTRLDYFLHDPNTGQVFPESLICNVPKQWRGDMKVIFQISFFVFFVTPMTIITVMYILIGKTLNKSGFTSKTTDSYDRCSAVSRARKAVIKMLVAVVIAFFICWAPYHAQRLMTSHITLHQWTPELMAIQTFLFYTSGVLYFIGSTVNPVLYNLMSRKFRQAFKRTLCRCCYTPEELAEMAGKSVLLTGTTNYTLYASMKRLSKDGTSMVSVQFNGYAGRGYQDGSGSIKSTNTSPVHSKLGPQTAGQRSSCNGFAVRNGRLSANLCGQSARCQSVDDVRDSVYSNPHTRPLISSANSYSNLETESNGSEDQGRQSANLSRGPSLNWVTRQGDRRGEFV